jgi:hypothetical protein
LTPRLPILFAGLALVLVVTAVTAPPLGSASDRGAYEATASRFIVPDCSDLHCFRVLVPWLIGSIPGPSLVKWKAYATLANLMAAMAVYALTLAWGLSARAALMAAALSGLGFGSLYTLYDPFTADPLMYALGPFLMWLLLRDRVAMAGTIAAVGVLGKEFAAAPALIFAAASALRRQYTTALRVLVAANVALIAWLCLQLILIIGFNYSYADSASTQLLSGGYLVYWLSRQSWMVSALAIVGEYGALWLLAPVGFWLAPAPMRTCAIAAIPAALAFAYVQQPDRALWNFHFLVTPLAALVLERAPVVLAWGCIAAYAVANLRLGGQLAFAPPSRVSLVMSVLLAAGCVFNLWRSPAMAAKA